MPLNPRESGKLIASLAKHVTINQKMLEFLGNEILECLKFDDPSTGGELIRPTTSKKPWALDWYFVVNTLTYCLWPNQDISGWTVEGQIDYEATCNAVNRAMRENIDILNPKYYSEISKEDLKKILRSDNEVEAPLLDERLKYLHEAGSVLLEKFDGSFINCVKQAENSVVKFIDIISNNFKCFRDEAIYKGHEISFCKMAQVLIGDIWVCRGGEELGYFKDMEEITIFCYHRIPEIFELCNLIEYSNELKKLLYKNFHLENESEMDIEIHGVCIYAAELIREFLANKIGKEKMETVNSLFNGFFYSFRRIRANDILEMKVKPGRAQGFARQRLLPNSEAILYHYI